MIPWLNLESRKFLLFPTQSLNLPDSSVEVSPCEDMLWLSGGPVVLVQWDGPALCLPSAYQ